MLSHGRLAWILSTGCRLHGWGSSAHVVRLGAVAGMLALVMLCLLPAALHAQAAAPAEVRCNWPKDYTNFYDPPDTGLRALENPGEIVRVEHLTTYPPEAVARAARIATSPYGAEAYRILYLSQGPAGIPQTVSALLVAPTGNVAPESLPVLVHGHGTVGMADQCAPSRFELSAFDLLPWIPKGYVVVATDYAGLGTPGLHPYGVGVTAAYSMLDSARAALQFCDNGRQVQLPAQNRVILEGHSQGGQAALFAAEYAGSYAPDLDVVGTVVFAPAVEFRFLAEQMAGQRWSARLTPFALAMSAFSQYYGAPQDLGQWLRPKYADDLVERTNNQCAVGLAGWVGFNPGNVFRAPFTDALRNSAWETLQPWADYVDANEPGNYSNSLPVLLMQGDFDTIVPPQAAVRFADRLCSNEVPVQVQRYAAAGHLSVIRRGLDEAGDWIDDRLAGVPLVNACLPNQVDDAPLARRSLEPVVLQGASLEALSGRPLDQLFVYAFQDGEWTRIPSQVDEVTASGAYTGTEDGVLDANDQVVFMAGDAGERAPEDPAAQLPIDQDWYAIEVTDPTSPTVQGWAYVVTSSELTATLAADGVGTGATDYVTFDAAARRISGQSYVVTLPPLRRGLETLVLGNGENILDRLKYRLECSRQLVCPVTEDALLLPPHERLVKDGPVRAILQNGAILAYGNMIQWTEPLTIPTGLPGDIRLTTDFAPAASGATLYTAATPDGIVVDGSADDLPAQPPAVWWQLSTDTGTLVRVSDLALLGGTPSTYYLDRGALDATDTGDKRHFGEIGLAVQQPSSEFTHAFALYMLPDSQPNRGQDYAGFYAQPLVPTARLRDMSSSTLYLPHVRHHAAAAR